MTIALPGHKTYLSVDDFDLIMDQADGKSAVVMGPGIGTNPATRDLVTRLYREILCA